MPPTSESDSPIQISDIIGSGTIILALLIGTLFLAIKFMKKSADRKVRSYQHFASPLYTGVSGRPRVYPGWYPTAAGDQDRYHDGQVWTNHYRPHTDESKLGDPPPPGVKPQDPEPPIQPEETAP